MNGRVPAEWDQPGSGWEYRGVAGGRFGDVGLILTVFYVFVTIISPEQFGNEWANYHSLTFLGGVIFLISLPGLFTKVHFRSSMQTFLLLGFIAAMGISEVANGWFGGVIVSWGSFLPSAVVFFFIVANVTTTRGLKILTLAIVASCLVVVVEALCGYYFGFRGETFIVSQTLFSQRLVVGEFVRIRGASFLSDPNDFAQILLIALPLTSIGWRPGRFVTNSLIVFAPAVLLLWGIYLTHSRGALIGLAILVLMTARKRMGTTASVIITILLSLGLIAVNFTGGRMISADAGADRLSLWASGLQMFKSAPIFGVGFGKFDDVADMTAHNSFVLCLAELGLLGSTFWVALLVTTMMGLNRILTIQEKWQTDLASATDGAREDQATFSKPLLPSFAMYAATSNPTFTAVDVQSRIGQTFQSPVPTQWIVAMRLALISFITTGWFLSRTYQSTVYLVLGLATAMIAVQRCGDESPARIRWVSYTLAVEAVAIIFIYEIVRLRF
jgi:O-antigen ligase